MNNNFQKELLASTAVFAEMANKGTNLKQVLADFILSTYTLEKRFSQTVSGIKIALTTHFDFDIPDAVIRTILKRLKRDKVLNLTEGKYIITQEARSQWDIFIDEIENKIKKQQEIFKQLISYAEQQKGPMGDEGKSRLLNCFSSNLFNESCEDKYSEIVNAFIIKNSKLDSTISELNLIQEGITILKGIKYNPEISQLEPWRKPLTIYLDTEHLFYICGYDGEVYKKLVLDLIDLIKKLNKEYQEKNNSNAITLKYLESSEEEVKGIFEAAKKIITGQSTLRHDGSSAVDIILNGASNVSDIIYKESSFFSELGKYGISKQIHVPLHTRFDLNIEDNFIYDKYKSQYTEKDISSILDAFNTINILREGRNNFFLEEIKHIIVTNSKNKLTLSKDPDVKQKENDFPFAVDIYYITQLLWFRLHRGLGFSNSLPSSLDVVVKAQILLSSHLKSSVRERYQVLEEDIKLGKKTEEEVKSFHLKLRSQISKPEDIKSDNVEEAIKLIHNEEDIEKFQENQAILKQKADKYDKLMQSQEREKVREQEAQRMETIGKAKYIYIKSKKRYGLYRYVSASIFILLFTIAIINFASKNDTTLSIISFVVGVIGIIPILKLKWVRSKLRRRAFKEFHLFLETNSLNEEDIIK